MSGKGTPVGEGFESVDLESESKVTVKAKRGMCPEEGKSLLCTAKNSSLDGVINRKEGPRDRKATDFRESGRWFRRRGSISWRFSTLCLQGNGE